MMMRLVMALARACGTISKKMDAAAAARDRYSISDELAEGAGCPTVVVLRDYQSGTSAAIAPSEGGQLTSFHVRFRRFPVELIYQHKESNSESGFRGRAGFLWPAIGVQSSDGFAGKLPWTELTRSVGADGAVLILELQDSEQSRADYPFGFVLRAVYELFEGRLSITYTVSAALNNAGPMPFLIGNRIAFRLPFVTGTKPEAMRFQSNCTTKILRSPEGILTGEQTERSFTDLTSLGEFDATSQLPLAGYQHTPYALLVDPQGICIRIIHQASAMLPEPVVRFNLSGGPGQGFLCPAPFFGMENSLNSGKDLVRLDPGADFHWRLELLPDVADAK